MNVFFLTPVSSFFFDHQYRTTWLHSIIYHGTVDYVKPKTLGNAVSECNPVPDYTSHLSVSRSGVFVPEIWAPNSVELVVSESIANQLSQISGIRFRDVAFSKLVDLPMPALGDDISWNRPGPINPDIEFNELPDRPEMRYKLGKFKAIACPRIYLIRKQIEDKQRLRLNFGSYADGEYVSKSTKSSTSVLFSRNLIESSPIFWDDVFIFREDAFSIIAPHINRDYFWIAWKDIDD